MADESFQQEFLQTHNAYRVKHKVPLMTLDASLSASAQRWADNLLNTGTFQHSNTANGENIYSMTSSVARKYTGKEAVDLWYSEIKDYSWNKPEYSSETGHFTQVVWKDSIKLGVGMATDGNKVFVVGQYQPAGNIKGGEYFEKNVLPTA